MPKTRFVLPLFAALFVYACGNAATKADGDVDTLPTTDGGQPADDAADSDPAPSTDTATTTAQRDCNALIAIDVRCDLGLNIDFAVCVQKNAGQPTTCRTANHAYVTCLSKLTCSTITGETSTSCSTEYKATVAKCPAKPAEADAKAGASAIAEMPTAPLVKKMQTLTD